MRFRAGLKDYVMLGFLQLINLKYINQKSL